MGNTHSLKFKSLVNFQKLKHPRNCIIDELGLLLCSFCPPPYVPPLCSSVCLLSCLSARLSSPLFIFRPLYSFPGLPSRNLSLLFFAPYTFLSLTHFFTASLTVLSFILFLVSYLGTLIFPCLCSSLLAIIFIALPTNLSFAHFSLTSNFSILVLRSTQDPFFFFLPSPSLQ